MITQKENIQYQNQFNSFIENVSNFKALLAANNIDFSIDIDVLTNAVRMPLFEKLLAIDKGLKMRFDLLKTDAAKIALIAQTIDLAGYDIIDQLVTSLNTLRVGYENNNGVKRIGELSHYSFDNFARVYQLNLPAALDSFTINFNGKESALSYFNSLADVLGNVRAIFHAAGFGCHLDDAMRMLAATYDVERHTAGMEVPGGKIELKEMAVWQLLNKLETNGALDVVPQAQG